MSRFNKGAERACRRVALLAATVIALAVPASAATFGLVGGTSLPGGSTTITAADKRANPTWGLTLDGKAHVTYTFLSGTPGAPYRHNQLVQNTAGWNLVFNSNKATAGATGAPILTQAGLLPFKMKIRATHEIFTNHNHHTTLGNVAVAFSEIFNGGKSVIVGFDSDGSGVFDDLVARIDIAAIPLPAAGWLLLGGLGLAAAASRRRTLAAA